MLLLFLIRVAEWTPNWERAVRLIMCVFRERFINLCVCFFSWFREWRVGFNCINSDHCLYTVELQWLKHLESMFELRVIRANECYS